MRPGIFTNLSLSSNRNYLLQCTRNILPDCTECPPDAGNQDGTVRNFFCGGEGGRARKRQLCQLAYFIAKKSIRYVFLIACVLAGPLIVLRFGYFNWHFVFS